jgi:ubiquinone/menaquinone biosynthesis C-methylase UbiE
MSLTSALYDAVLWRGERRGMRDHRAAVLGQARGRTLEIGAGTGLNLPYYPDAVTELVLTEPVDAMSDRLARRAAKQDAAIQVVAASAEELPYPDGSFDTVVSTMVICTVEDPGQALAEIARVLKPGGQMLFIEHVRSDSPRLARWQDRLHGLWHAFGDGCNCNRPILEMVAGAVAVDRVERATWRGMPRIVHPLVLGRAVSAS